MERTTTCIPCVPSILQGFRRSGSGVGLVGKGDGRSGKDGTGGGDSEGDEAMGNGKDYPPNKLKSASKMTTSETEATVGSNNAANNNHLPNITSLSATGFNSSIKIHPLQKGKTSLGKSSQQDIVIEGAGVDDQHCYIINEGQVVTFYPLAVLNSVDGFRVTKPTKLNHGSVLCFGHSVYFRFNYPPQKSNAARQIVIKGSSPDDENRRRLIKLQSKPGAQEVSVTRTSFPVPDASQFYWVDFDKELGLKPSSPIKLKTTGSVGRVAETRVTPQSAFSHIRPASSQSWDTRLSRHRFPGQGLEIYPKENSECESPSSTFLSSPPHFPHDSRNGAKTVGQFPRPVINRKDQPRLDDESDSGTHSTETSSLSSSHSSGVKVSLVEHVGLSPIVQDRTDLHRTRVNAVPTNVRNSGISTGTSSASCSASTVTVTSSCSDANSSVQLCRNSGGYDNIANIKAAIFAAATAKLANSSPAVVENRWSTRGRPRSLQVSSVSSSVSPPDSSKYNTLRTIFSEKLESSQEPAEAKTLNGNSTGEQSIELSDVSGLADSEDKVSSSEVCAEDLPNGGSLVASSSCNLEVADQQTSGIQEVLAEKPEAADLEPVNENSSALRENADLTGSYVDLDCIPAVSSSESKPDRDEAVAESSESLEEHETLAEKSENLPLATKTDTKTENNSISLANDFSVAEDSGRIGVCSSKPPIGKFVPESKVIKTDRKNTKSDKKPSEPLTTSFFKSLLSRSRSPSPKGRSGRSNSPSSPKESITEHVNQQSTVSHLQKETDKIVSKNESDVLIQDLVRRSKSEESDRGCAESPELVEISEKSHSGETTESSSENPWRVNLRQSLRPNLENFKGEKVFTKDTVITNVFVGVGLDGSRNSSPRVSLTSGENSSKSSGILPPKTAKISGISDSAQDLRSIQSSDQPVHAEVDFGYISDSGISAAGRVAKFCRPKGKKSVTFAEEHRKGSQENSSQDSSPENPPDMSHDMDRFVEGRSPTEKMPVTENVRTYLEIVDSNWQKGKTSGDQIDLSNGDQNNRVKNQNGVCNPETDDIQKSKSDVIDSNEFNSLPEFNNNSSHGSDVKQMNDGKTKSFDERQSVSLDDLDLDDIGASQQDLKQLYQLQRAGRVEEQRRAEVEKQRLEEILKMCSEFGVNTDLETTKKCEPKSNVDLCRALNSSSSNSEDDVERDTIKRRPVLDKVVPVNLRSPEPPSLFKLENCSNDDRPIVAATVGRTLEDDLSPASPIADSGIDIGAVDRPFMSLSSKEFLSTFRDRRPSEEHRPSLDRMHLDDRRPSDEFWPAGEYQARHLTSCDTEYSQGSYSSRMGFHKLWNDEKSKQAQLDLLGELQRDVVRSITDIKQKITDIEARQNEAVREVEMERALLEGEQQIQMEQLDRIKEKIATLESKESNLLAEAASQRAKEVEKIRLEKEKLLDLERQLQVAKDLASRNTNSDKAEILKNRCSEIQDAVDNHRFIVDNLEFQQLEVEAHFEEEKESVQRELASERAYLDSIGNQHQVTLKQIALQQSDLLKQVDFDVFELEKERQRLAELFQKENAALYNINCQIRDALPSSAMIEDDNQDEDVRLSHTNRWHRPRLSEAEVDSSSRSSHGSPRRLPAKFSHTIPKIDSQRTRTGGEASDDEDRRFLYEIKKRSGSRTLWERSCDLPDGGVGEGALVQWQGPAVSAAPAANSESEDSSVSGSDPLSDKAISLSSKEDQLHDMECLLVLAKAEGLRLVEEQMHQRDIEREALEQERKRRKELELRLAEEIAKHNDVIEQAIRLREKEKLQARPLTRYLPVRDRSLDLLQFIVAAGHSVDQCPHLAMTSTSCRGFLTKMGSRIRTWKKRWFVFDRTKRCLSYYGDKSESRPRGVVYFQAVEDVFVDHLHQVKSPTPQLTFCVKTYDRMYYLMAPSPDAMRIWIDVIFTGAEGYQQFA